MLNKSMFSSNKCEWSTPQSFFDDLNKEFNFDLDVCALPDNTKCKNYFTPDINGLDQKWIGNVWCNPPYGKTISSWIEKAYNSVNNGDCNFVVMLLPARTDTRYFHTYIYNKQEIRFIKGRLKFGDSKTAAPFPSMVVIFRKQRI